MSAATAARPYARAVFAAARAGDALAAYSDMLALARDLAGDARLARLLDDPRLPRARRVEALCAIAGSRIDAVVRRLLETLAERGRLAALGEIARQFERLRERAEGRMTARVVCARPLEPAQAEALRAALAARSGRQVALEQRTDATLLGGAVVRTDDDAMDGSLRGRLARLARSLAGAAAERRR